MLLAGLKVSFAVVTTLEVQIEEKYKGNKTLKYLTDFSEANLIGLLLQMLCKSFSKFNDFILARIEVIQVFVEFCK